ncbi:hypothetical protein [Magnetovibrio blakemorei]|uniref:Hemerythrin-like domain-containing protein n=1 Tax=Magnetovibrio blakemorei TaxID=28181 RepID=A0A1E5Q9Z9_9PROT|nr:hypothetical protein [Magnetovibrio blakemorei]OEJ68468.1 hypothetical protein BEN30_05915 [Magnetovibrio blakemorei]
MLSFEDLHMQNHQIAELAKTLSYLFQDREMCDSGITCELFERYRDKFDTHMSHNKQIYSELLNNNDGTTRAIVGRFIEGEKEIKRLFKKYAEKWCKKGGLRIADHAEFVKETDKMFDLVWNRIQAESEQLYPLARKQDTAA